MSGWIRIDRKIQDNEVLNEKPFDKFHAWMDLLLMAEYEPRTIEVNGVEIALQPGQIFFSQNELADRWGWTPKKVRCFLKNLERANMGRTEGRTEGRTLGTTLTLINWGKYQGQGRSKGRTEGRGEGRTLNNSIIDNYIEGTKEQKNNARVSRFRNYDERHTDYETLFGEAGQ